MKGERILSLSEKYAKTYTRAAKRSISLTLSDCKILILTRDEIWRNSQKLTDRGRVAE